MKEEVVIKQDEIRDESPLKVNRMKKDPKPKLTPKPVDDDVEIITPQKQWNKTDIRKYFNLNFLKKVVLLSFKIS